MSKTNFIVGTPDGGNADIGDLLVRRDYFTEGGLWGWGQDNYGQLGDNSIVNKSSPVQTIAGGTNWKQISCGAKTFSAIKTDGTLWSCGYNQTGQLGNNSTVHRSSPVQTICGGTNWKMVSCGGNTSTAAIKTDGTLWLWGQNDQGQLGTNSIISRSSPVQTICGGNNWLLVSTTGNCCAAIKTDGTLWLWGQNNQGQLGINSIIYKSSPVQTISGGNNWKTVSSSTYGGNIMAIKTDGTLWGWGDGSQGQLGDNSTTTRSSPVQIIAGGTNWSKCTAGIYQSAAIKTDGTLWTWGYNTWGQLGDNTRNTRLSPIQTIAGGTNWKQVSINMYNMIAIKTDGTLWTWGYNAYGQLGDNTTISKSSPIQTIAAGTNWKMCSCGLYNISAIKDDIS